MYFFYYFPVGLDIEVRRRVLITWFITVILIILFFIFRYKPVGSGWNLFFLAFYPSEPSPLTAITHAFLHTGYLHLAGNIVYLVVFGRAVEGRFGPGRFFLIFTLSAALGAYTHLALTKLFAPAYLRSGVIGASGATSGLLGAFMVRFYYCRIKVAYWVFCPLQGVNKVGRAHIPVICAILLWLLLQGVLTVLQFGIGGVRVAYSVHLGGLFTGIVMSLLFGSASSARAERHLARARSYFKESNWFGSQGEYTNYLHYRPGDAGAHAEAARTFICTRGISDARYHYTKAVEGLLGVGERGLAEEVFTEAMRVVDGFCLSERLHLDIACGMERSLKFRSALAGYENFICSYPESKEAPFVLLRMAGMLERRFRKTLEALSRYKQLVDSYPDDVWVDFARYEIDRLEGIWIGGY